MAALPALRSAIDSLAADRRVTLESVWPAAIAPIAAGWYRADQRPMLILLAQIAESESVAAELSELLGERVDVFSTWQRRVGARVTATSRDSSAVCMCSVGCTTFPLPIKRPATANARRRRSSLRRCKRYCTVCRVPIRWKGTKRILSAGRRVDVDDLRTWLVKAGYHATSSVQLPGEFAVRGGIMDIYPPDEPMPVRIELFGDEIESLRTFDITSQRSIEQRKELQLLAVQGSVAQDGSLLDYLTERTVVFVHERPSIAAATDAFSASCPVPRTIPCTGDGVETDR